MNLDARYMRVARTRVGNSPEPGVGAPRFWSMSSSRDPRGLAHNTSAAVCAYLRAKLRKQR